MDQLQGRICALHSVKPTVALGGRRRSEISTAGEEGSTGEPQTREEGSSPVVRDEILTTEEVCTLLKIKKATLYRHTSQGTGPPFYKIGKHNRWKRSEVMAWFDAHLDELSRSGR
jgi:excisionase family DNA binding protein